MLAIFDIDGTLTRTNAVDDACYARAVAEALGLRTGDVDWTDAPHVTDAGIATWLWERHRGARPYPAEIATLRRRFCELLAEAHAATPAGFAPVPGACGLLPFLRANGWHVAMATGGWRASAEFKLQVAGIEWSDVVLATADDASTREAIVTIAHAGAERAHATTFRRVVSVGDARWDVRTAAARRLPFVGIGAGEAADRLRAAGADVVLADFTRPLDVLDALARARVPAHTGQATNGEDTCRPG
jgi:phosphoglycolate phosphatase-like HAD superfamily hydrolase